MDDPAGWRYEPEANCGTLHSVSGQLWIPFEQGRYQDYYDTFAAAVRTGSAPPVTAAEGARTLAELDAARQSAMENRSITL